ncbi:hypothetical protein ACFO0N_16425 [Halobium salinum]|uniref:DUF7999 domain-containing protein n=1 Tax=Halobium salinum TaxID=1364940 RepID=A0ABD5PF98_9EURY|nr:hypothetical protein [Halobium salinum]
MPLHESRADAEATEVTVVRPMNAHGGMTLEDASGAQYHVVEYRTTGLRKTLRSLPVGATLPVDLVAVGSRGNAWRAVAMGED